MDSEKFKFNTTIVGKTIIQEIEKVSYDYRQTILRQILDTADKRIREDLIKLGWTPPEENEDGKQSQ